MSALLDPRAKNKADAAMLGVLDLAAGVAAHQPNICLVDCSALDFVTRFSSIKCLIRSTQLSILFVG